MATLSDSTQLTRKFAKWGAILIVGAFVLTFAASFITEQIRLLGVKVQVATNGFGDLPEIKLTSGLSIDPSVKPIYDLQTTNGRLYITDSKNLKFDTPPTIGYVYKYYQTTPSLYLNDEIKALGKKIGYTSTPQDLGTVMRFQSDDSFQLLEINKLTRDIQIFTDITKDSTFDTVKPFTAGFDQYQSSLFNDLKQKGILNSNYNDSRYVSEFGSEFITWNADKQTYVRADSASRAELIRINLSKFVPLQYVEIPSTITGKDAIAKYLAANQASSLVRTDDPRKTSVHAIMGTTAKQIYFLDVNGTQYDTDKPETYNLISIQEAYQKIQNGEGVLADLRRSSRNDDYTYTPETVTAFHINKISIDYYEPTFRTQLYLQPIYVFSGYADLQDGTLAEFTYYLPAIAK